jgi:hypothetical protein
MLAEPTGKKKPVSPNQREDNPITRALLGTVMSGGGHRESMEHFQIEKLQKN